MPADQAPTQSDSRLRYEARRLRGLEGPAVVGVLPEMRRWYWRFVRRYEYEICNDCGRPVSRSAAPTWWAAPDLLWNTIVGSEHGVLCMACFTDRADGRGFAIRWVAEIDG